MSDRAIRRFDRLGLTLLAVYFATAAGLAVSWYGLQHVDHADRLLVQFLLVGACLYLTVACLIAGVVYDSVASRLAIRFYTLAGVAGILAFIPPAVTEALR